MENGGKPIRNIIFATWRSGSTFVGELTNSHPGMFYVYEPLRVFGDVQVCIDYHKFPKNSLGPYLIVRQEGEDAIKLPYRHLPRIFSIFHLFRLNWVPSLNSFNTLQLM